MKIVDTFVVVENSLISVQYDTEVVDELTRLFTLWNDATYLFDFFTEHQNDLTHDFWNEITIEEAVERTRNEAKRLEKKLLEVAESGNTNAEITLSSIFKPLSKNKIEKELEKDKLKGDNRPSWLRIYAIRIDLNLFLITGGAIKLTKTMNDRTHTLVELDKLELVKKYIQENEEDIFEDYEI